MNDYVTNLVRRSVGLAPLAAPRVPAAPLVPEPALESPALAAAPVLSAQTVRTEPGAHAPVAQLTLVHAEHEQPPAPLPAALPAPSLRAEGRLPPVEVAAREPARVETTVIVPARAEPAPRAEPVLERAAARPLPTTLPAQPESNSGATPAPDLPAPIVLPARVEAPPASEPMPREVLPFEIVRELTHRFERIIEPAPAAALPPTAPPLAPAVVPAAHRMPETPVPENRIVQVRIGAIEIHGAAPAPAAPAPVAASAAAPRVAQGGFEQFARLRSYAQWEW